MAEPRKYDGSRPARRACNAAGIPAPHWRRSVKHVASLAILFFALLAPAALGGTVAVNTTDDEYDFIPNATCSIREAIVTINEQRSIGIGGCSVSGTLGTGDTIVVPDGLYYVLRFNTAYMADQERGNLNLRRDMTIQGNGARNTVIGGFGISSPSGGVMEIAPGVTVTLRQLAIATGRATIGGGIFNRGDLTLEEVDVWGNDASMSGGGIDNDSGASLTILKSLIRDNKAVGGGGLMNRGSVVIENSTFTGNLADGGGGIGNGGTAILSSVTITANRTEGNDTVQAGAGISNSESATDVQVENSVIAGNVDLTGKNQPDCAGEFSSRDFNLIGDGTGCSGFTGINDQVGSGGSEIDPLLAALANNGGLTDTHRLRGGSPAIDGGPLGLLDSCLSEDQRGDARPNDGDGNGFLHCDIGAYEAPAATRDPEADLMVSLSDVADPVIAGGAWELGVRVENLGPDEASGVTLVLTFPSGTGLPTTFPWSCSAVSGVTLSCDVGTLDAGEGIDASFTATAPGTPSTYIVTAAADAATADASTANNTDQEATFVSAAASADLQLSMVGPIAVLVNEEVAYELVATNTGPGDATGVVVANRVPSNTTFVSATAGCTNSSGLVSCVVGDLEAGAAATFDVVVRAPNRVANVTNTASVSGSPDPDTSNNNDSFFTRVETPPSADLFIEINGPAEVAPGSTFAYTVIPFNNGPDAAGDVTVSLDLDAGLTFLSAPSFCSEGSGLVTCDLGTMEPFGAVTTFSVQAQAPVTEGTVDTTAAISGSDDDPYPDNDSDVAQSTVTADVANTEADVSVTKTGPAEVAISSSTLYTLNVYNAGAGAAADVEVVDVLPPGLAFVSASAECTESSLTVTCALGSMPSGAAKTLTILATSPSTPGNLTNTASVTTSTGDTDPSNDSDTLVTEVRDDLVPPDDGLVISATTGANPPGPVNAGAGDASVEVVHALIQNGTAIDAELASIEVSFASAARAADAFATVRVYLDGDGNGQVDAGDALLGSASPAQNAVAVAAALDLPATTSAHLLVAVDVRPDVASVPLRSLASLGGLFLATGWLGRNRRKARTALMIAIVALLAVSCGGPAGQAQPRTYDVSLTGVTAASVSGGDAAQVTGLPVTGTRIQVGP